MVGQPHWQLVLSYELEIRRNMMKLVTKGTGMGAALRSSWKDPVVKERFFTTPLALQGGSRKRPAESMEAHAESRPKGGPSRPKGKGKGKNKGKSKSGSSGLSNCAVKTPDGKNVCYAFNNQAETCTRKNCPFLHVCGICFKDHPMYRCSGRGQP